MKESTIIVQFTQLWGTLKSISENFRSSLMAQSIHDSALEKLLISKNLITKEELETAIQNEVKELVKSQTPTSSIVSADGSALSTAPVNLPPEPTLTEAPKS